MAETYHNGTGLLISLPLWNGLARRTGAERLLDGGIARRAYHNGSAASLMPSSETPSREMWHLSRRV